MAENNNNAPPGGPDDESVKRFAKWLELQEQSVEEAEKLLDVYKNVDDSLSSRLLVTQQEIEVTKRKQSYNERLLKDEKLLLAEAEKRNVTAEELVKILQKEAVENEKKTAELKLQFKYQDMFTASTQESVAAAEDLAKGLASAMTAYDGPFNIGMFKGLSDAIQGGTTSLKAFGAQAALSIAATMINQVVNLAISLHDASGAFRRATGASAAMAGEMTEVYGATRDATVSIEQASAAYQGLYRNFTDFTLVSKAERIQLGKTGAVLAELGVSNEAFGKSIQTSTKMFGQSVTEAGKTAIEIKEIATNLGLPVDELAGKYASMGPSLAKLGSQGTKAFKDLAHISKITGMEMESVLRITDKFDTFEGAADQAGKLNAALGGNFVNAMDLMMATDPGERFGMIRDSILDAGLSFDDMSYYQRQFYVDSLGLKDAGELAMMLSGDMSTLGGATEQTTADYQKMADQAKATANFQDKLNAVFMQLIPILEPIILAVGKLPMWLEKNIDKIKTLTRVVTLLAGIFVVVKVVMAVLAIKAMLITAPLWLTVAAVLAVIAAFVWLKNLLFVDPTASTFLEGLAKIAFAFKDIAVAVLETINPFNQIVKVVDAFGNLISGVLAGVTGLFTALTNPAAADNIMKIGAAISDIPYTKTGLFAGAMTAAAAAATAAQFIGVGGGGGGAGGGGATQTVRQPIKLEIGGKPMADFVLEVVGKEIRSINMGT